MGLNPTGSEIPRSLTEIGTTIDAALDGKADFVRLAANPSNVNVVSSYEVTGELYDASISISTPVTLTNQGTDVWESGTDGLSVDSGYWLLEIDTGSWISNEDTSTAPENCTWTPQGNAGGTPVLAFSPAITKTPGQFALVNNSVLWENLGTDASPNWKVASGKADFVRLTVNPGVSTVVSRYQVGGSLAYDGNQVANGPDFLYFQENNFWRNDNANEAGGTSSLFVSSNRWQLNYGTEPSGTWLSVQTIATRPENCTWEAAGLESGDPVLTFTPATVAATGQFALVDDTVNPPVMWQNLGDDTTPEWAALTTATAVSALSTALSAHTTATGNVHGLSGANVRSILGVSTLSGSNTGDQDLSGLATTSAVAAGYQPLDADLTAIAALSTTSTGRALLTESTAQTGTGALVRAASPTLTGDPTAPTQTAGNDSTRIATTAFVAAGFVPRITSVDNQLVRFDGTTGAAQGSGITVDDSNNVTGVGSLAASSITAAGGYISLYSNGGIQASNGVNNNNRVVLGNGTCVVSTDGHFGITDGTYTHVSSVDSRISRQSAGVLQIGTTANNALGSLALTNLTASGTGTFSSISETSVAATGTGALVRAASPTLTGTLTAAGVSLSSNARFTEQTYTPTGTTQTIDLNSGNLNTLSLGSTTGDVTLTLTVPTSAASGRIKIIQHGTTARGITIALSAGTAVWYSAIPAFSSQAISKKTILSYTWDGTDMSLQAAEAS